MKVAVFDLTVEDIHGRRPDESRDKQVQRLFIELCRWAYPLNLPLVEQNGFRRHRHRFRLVVRDVDRRRFERLM